MLRASFWRGVLTAGMLLLPAALQATSLECDVQAECPAQPRHAWVPYGFYNQATGFAGAVAFVGAGYLQPQFTTVVNAFAGTNVRMVIALASPG